MRKKLIIALCLYVLTVGAKVSISKLTVEGRESPIGLDDSQPRFGWQIVSDHKSVVQQSYRLL